MTIIRETVQKIVAEKLGIDEAKISDSSSFVDDLGADSLDTVEIVMALEEEFSFEIPDEDTSQIQTFGNLVNYVENAVSNNKNA